VNNKRSQLNARLRVCKNIHTQEEIRAYHQGKEGREVALGKHQVEAAHQGKKVALQGACQAAATWLMEVALETERGEQHKSAVQPHKHLQYSRPSREPTTTRCRGRP
jgi:hypothetical protein